MDWALLMHELVVKLVKALPKAKDTPLSSYLAHLYHHYELLRKEEVVSCETQERIQQYGGTDSDSESEASIPKLPESSHPEPVRQVTRQKTTPRNLDDIPERRKKARLNEPGSSRVVTSEEPADQILAAVDELRR